MSLAGFHPLAQAEFDEAFAHYAALRSSLGAAYLASIQSAVGQVSRHSASAPVIRDDVRCVRAEGFPYSVMYRVHKDEIRVLAVAHNRRRPYYWLSRR